MSVLITGATGFIGARLLRRLEGEEVHALLRPGANAWRLEGAEYTPHFVDISDYASLQSAVKKIRPKKIFHLAGYGVYPTQTDMARIFESNIKGTINLVRALEKTEYESFVFSGSGFEYGFFDKPISESDPIRPPDPYSLSKASASLFLIHEAQTKNLPINVARFFLVYGYYEASTRLIPTLVASYLNSQSPQLSSKKHVRDFVFVEDVVDALVKLSESGLSGEAFNIGSGKEHTVEEVAEKVKGLFGSSIEPTWGVAEKRAFEPQHWCADITKAKKLLGWKPAHTLEQGLEKTIAWHKKRGKGI